MLLMSSYSGKSPLCAASWGARRAEAMKLLINDLATEKKKDDKKLARSSRRHQAAGRTPDGDEH